MDWTRLAVMVTVLAVWGTAMINWIVFQHTLPDPIFWGLPQGVYLALFPQQLGKGNGNGNVPN